MGKEKGANREMVEEKGFEGPEEVVRQRLREAAAAATMVSTIERAATGTPTGCVLTRLLLSKFFLFTLGIYLDFSNPSNYLNVNQKKIVK